MQAYGKQKRKKRRWPIVLLAVAVLAAALYLPVKSWVQQYRYPIAHSETVERWADEYGVDPYLVYAIIRTESGFNPQADSSAGARGLMQMTEDTFEWIKGKIAPDEALTFADLYDPAVSIRFGVYFYALSLQRYGGDISTAAAAYHSGWGTVDGLLADGAYSANGAGYLSEFPYSQMGHYVNKVNNSYQKYIQIYSE